MKKQTFTATIKNDNIHIHQKIPFLDLLQKNQDKDIKLIITEATTRDIRNLEQNGLYWAVVGQIAEYTGDEKEYLHEIFKYQFFGEDVTTSLPNGKTWIHRLPCLTTTELDTKEFSEGVDKIIKWAEKELDIKIENPNQPPKFK